MWFNQQGERDSIPSSTHERLDTNRNDSKPGIYHEREEDESLYHYVL